MRAASTYRGARRNAARAAGTLRNWRNDGHAVTANATAKLAERQKQCREAVHAMFAALAKNELATGLRRAAIATEALREYWSKQKRTRVVSRILRSVAAA